mgnify:CR=1 FL=1
MNNANIFDVVRGENPGTNRFDLSHEVKLTHKMGQLIPLTWLELNPGDRVSIDPEVMVRFAPMLAPVMHMCNINVEAFAVPMRVLWEDWEDFITGETELDVPYLTNLSGLAEGDLGDYLGLPPSMDDTIEVSAFPVQAYLKIFDDYYRDQNLVNEKAAPLDPGRNAIHENVAKGAPLRRAWHRDYFTSALPTAQKGDTVTIPLTDTGALDVQYRIDGDSNLIRNATNGNIIDGSLSAGSVTGELRTIGDTAVLDPNGQMFVDTNVNAASIIDLRRAFKLQEYLELLSRAGSRYTEYISSMFGVRSSDGRLQRAEYVGGIKHQAVFSEVLSTADTVSGSDGNVIGAYGGHGVGLLGGHAGNFYAEEHCIFMAILSVTPRTGYSQGIHRTWLRKEPTDYYIPQFAHIGEQAIQNVEVHANHTNLDGTFGYAPRYSELKYMNSRLAGQFRTSLDFWHLNRQLPTNVALNEDFIECDPDTRIFAVETGDHCWTQSILNIKVDRKMPRFGNPKL